MGPTPTRDAVLTAYAKSLIQFKARQLSRKPGFSRSDEEDVVQELTVHLLSKANLFDPNRASVNTFADRVIKSAIAMILRDRARQKRAAGFAAQSLEQTSVTQEGRTASLRDVLRPSDLRRRTGAGDEQRRAEAVAAVAEVLRSLPPDLLNIASSLMAGRAVASVARDLGISRRQVRNAVERMRRHFEAAGLGDS